METETVTALATIEQLTPMQLFSPGALDPILERIRTEARAAAAELDISTPDSRKAIASLAYKVARTKTYMDERRVELVADRKKEIAAIDGEGRRFREAMDALRDEVRAELTAWETAEEERTEEHERRIRLIGELGAETHTSIALVDHALTQIDTLWDHNFQEFTKRASQAREHALLHLSAERANILREIAAKVEQERVRVESEEKARVAREAKIAEDARLKAEAEAKRREEANALAARQREEEQARIAAEDKARLEREKNAADERARKAEADRKKAEDDRIAAEKKAESDRIAAERKVESDRIAAAKKAEDDRVAAIEAERKRVEDARSAEEEATRKREQDRAHRGKINREAVAALMKSGVAELTAKTVIELIARKLIIHVSITY